VVGVVWTNVADSDTARPRLLCLVAQLAGCVPSRALDGLRLLLVGTRALGAIPTALALVLVLALAWAPALARARGVARARVALRPRARAGAAAAAALEVCFFLAYLARRTGSRQTYCRTPTCVENKCMCRCMLGRCRNTGKTGKK